MLKINHSCGFEREMDFMCPKCNQPFCEGESQQALGGLLLGHLKNYEKILSANTKIANLISQIEILKAEFSMIKDKINKCKYCNKLSIDVFFKQEIINIKGIGIKIADDIVSVYPTKEMLKNAVANNEKLPFPDNVEKILREKYK